MKKLLLILAILIIPIANAFGASAPYFDDRTLSLAPGETETVEILLQNMVGNEDIMVRADITQGEGIATLGDESREYLIPAHTKDVPVMLEITIPENTEPYATLPVEVTFSKVANDESATVSLTGRVVNSFDVIVAQGEEIPLQITKAGTNLFYILITTILLVTGIVAGILVRTVRRKYSQTN